MSEVGIKLRDRVLKEAKVLQNDIIDVSSFMDSYVDVDLMDECANDLAERFKSDNPNKILTVATTGLVVAIRECCPSMFLLWVFFSLISSCLNLNIQKQWPSIYKCPWSMLGKSVPLLWQIRLMQAIIAKQ